MAAGWQDLATQQAELLSDRLKELLSTGLGLLRSELGVDVDLKPELYPAWVILLTAFLGLLVTAVFWAATCGWIFGGKKRAVGTIQETNEATKASVTRAVKTEEQKKKSKKKPSEKKAQPNGRTVVDLQEDIKASEENLEPFPAEVKTEKVKKNKKKPKAEVKPVKTATTSDGKEPDEAGTWETKISNREKRQQRKKDKQTEDSGSLGAGDPPNGTPVEQARPTVTMPAGQRKGKGDAQRVKAEKGEVIIPQVSASWSESSALNAGGWKDRAVKLPVQTLAPDAESWSTVPKATEATTWGQEIKGSWSGRDGRMETELSSAPFTRLGLHPTGESRPVSDLQWDTMPQVDDEWSGFNGTADPGSDWNAPAEEWGNYEEPQPDRPAPPEEPVPEDKGSEEEKGDGAVGESGKPKKKKKKKRKQEDAGGASQEAGETQKEVLTGKEESSPVVKEKPRSVQAGAPAAQTRPERPAGAPDGKFQKPATQVPPRLAEAEANTKQNSAPAPAQKKPEDNTEAPKQVKKKKARRET
ncbi:hypothetical protein GJAV_G00019730 [Gymnothorax javanicus]|nr:hypothetical protein GJAV_G00019730 [Gymnothorax javanicus]